ncbi:uncharacterized protein LOC119665071 isoform X2 [Teleopsis dalmanni]|nr:uncharacterized protein LOC119663215 isoform X2 [Teleopsis dalmanni]XP_037928848.1 uncharacterized protein LOC119663265 isoform X2 [Teleopsis dalmanni]XP_037929160.1 uncharacterized protein LOC119663622 isoform X2 [Teleopsis dalmanni]XP_037929360.1 uncharacterized protein LOC119663831 isoform X2 [Teleopsis dalmanni]XP_037929489.1 uncharacterized protein LOC119663975 isoform X2 [Teleopsis dalmanni]XP_037929745.1 uncharacterized protein LOC119664304 isoform X2 [Teleopsis dalmanni]XP_03793032
MNKDNNGLIPRAEFIYGIIKFDTSRMEMGAVADLFDRNGGDPIGKNANQQLIQIKYMMKLNALLSFAHVDKNFAYFKLAKGNIGLATRLSKITNIANIA